MTTRERTLVCLVAASFLAASGNYAYEHFPSPGIKASSSQAGDVSRAVQELGAALTSMPLTDAKKFILQKSRILPGRECFLPPRPATASQKKEQRTQEATSLVYSGFIDVAGSRLAVINGMEYAEEDTIPSTGDIVRHITGHAVTLFSTSRNTEWELPYSGDEF